MDEPRSGIVECISCGREHRLAAGYSLIYYFFLTTLRIFQSRIGRCSRLSADCASLCGIARHGTPPTTPAGVGRELPLRPRGLRESRRETGLFMTTVRSTVTLTPGLSTSSYVVSDTFTVTARASITGLSFGAWLSPGDTLMSVEVSNRHRRSTTALCSTGTVNLHPAGRLPNQHLRLQRVPRDRHFLRSKPT